MQERTDPPVPMPDAGELRGVIEFIAREALTYLDGVSDRPVRTPRVDEAMAKFSIDLPETGQGASRALAELIDNGLDAAVTSGPRYFHFVMGGSTPAALGADWFTSVLDQVAYAWVSSPLAVDLEMICLRWLRDLFELPKEWGGIFTTGATMANFIGLAAARQWWGEQHGIDVSEAGLSQAPSVPVFSGGYIHASAVKALAMLGIGRASNRVFARDDVGRLDLEKMEGALRDADGPAIIIANAGEVNAGDFDPIEKLADLARTYNAWLHVDGAFGLFAAVSPRTKHLVKGVERAHSVTVDGHKWLNVPYDCGFAFVSDPSWLGKTFTYQAAYLPRPEDPRPVLGSRGPESSRRARSLAVWATLRAYGRQGYRRIIEQHLDLTQKLVGMVDNANDLERLADAPLNIVCFRYNPGGLDETVLNDLNRRLGEAILEDGRVYVGITTFGEKVAIRPSIVNWRTAERDINLLVETIRELGSALNDNR